MRKGKRMKLLRKVVASVVSVAMAASFCCVGNIASAFADDELQTVTCGLTIVDLSGTTPNVVYNGVVTGLMDYSTVGDMLESAGFYYSEESFGDDDASYKLSYGSPEFLGKEYDAATGNYWCTMGNGSSKNYADAQVEDSSTGKAITVKDGYTYQYVYGAKEGYTTFDSWGYPDTLTYSSNLPDPFSAQGMGITIAQNLANRFDYDGENQFIDNNTYMAAVGMAHMGFRSRIGAEYIKSAIDTDEEAGNLSAGRLAKYIVALDAAGADTDSYVRQLEGMISESLIEGDYFVYSGAPILAALSRCDYTNAYAAKVATALIEALDSKTGLYSAFGSVDYMTTAQVIDALADYYDAYDNAGKTITDTAKKACNIAWTGAKSLAAAIQKDGSWADSYGSLDTTATVAYVLDNFNYCIYDSSWLPGSDYATPAAYLVSKVDEDLTYFTGSSASNENMSAANVLAALSCCCGASDEDDNFVLFDWVTENGKADISWVAFETKTLTYNGNAQATVVTGEFQGKKLVGGVDFIVVNNSFTGAGYYDGTMGLLVKGIGDFSGDWMLCVDVRPAKVTSVTAKSTKSGKVTVGWSNAKAKAAGADGFKAYVYYGSKCIKTVTLKSVNYKSTTITLAKKYKGKKVHVVVRAYAKSLNEMTGTVWSVASAAKYVKVKK